MNQNEKRMILTSVQKPGRYAGGEYGQVIKDRAAVSARFAFCFPDTYEIGMSNLGVRILYHCLNLHERIWCERVYDPWVDMQEKMKEYDLPLTAVESGDPLSVFDFIGFTLQYEMSYTNVLNMLELGRVPIWARERGEQDPLVIGGGPCSYNPEPVADSSTCSTSVRARKCFRDRGAVYRHAGRRQLHARGVPAPRRRHDSRRVRAVAV